ncbi:MAG TPA: S1 RNA-binding domain-containing protein [Solimonas sp.]
MLEGTVTNVAAFGAFVDIGVHQDGLVHVSQLADKFVKDPHEVVKAGDVVKVRVVEVDVKRKRIALSMKKDDAGASRGGAPAERSSGPRDRDRRDARPAARPPQAPPKPQQGSLGAALMDALKKK